MTISKTNNKRASYLLRYCLEFWITVVTPMRRWGLDFGLVCVAVWNSFFWDVVDDGGFGFERQGGGWWVKVSTLRSWINCILNSFQGILSHIFFSYDFLPVLPPDILQIWWPRGREIQERGWSSNHEVRGNGCPDGKFHCKKLPIYIGLSTQLTASRTAVQLFIIM